MHHNILVLKGYRGTTDRGVVLIKYSELLNVVPLLFDLCALQDRYHLVLEPSTAARMQPFLRMFDATRSTVAIQTLSREEEHAFAALGYVPLPVCAGDWLDEAVFGTPTPCPPTYDFVMIGNFVPMKRYASVFAALRRFWPGKPRFALAGTSWVGDADYVKRLLEQYGLADSAEVFVDLEQKEVKELLVRASCYVLASLYEGANRSSFEALFCGCPVVIPTGHVGFPAWRFPELVRTYRSGRELVSQIQACSGAVDRVSLGTAARGQIGSARATRVVNGRLREVVGKRGEELSEGIVRKVNHVQCSYADRDSARRFGVDFHFLEKCSQDGCYDAAYALSLLAS